MEKFYDGDDIPEDIQYKIAKSKDYKLQKELAASIGFMDVSKDIQLKLTESESLGVRLALVECSDEPEVLDNVSKNLMPKYMKNVIDNDNVSKATLTRIRNEFGQKAKNTNNYKRREESSKIAHYANEKI